MTPNEAVMADWPYKPSAKPARSWPGSFPGEQVGGSGRPDGTPAFLIQMIDIAGNVCGPKNDNSVAEPKG